VSKPLNEENIIRLYRECPSEVRDMFLQKIVKLEHFSESLSLLINVSIMVIEVQWVCSLLSQVLGIDNEKHVVQVMLSFLLVFLKSESGQSICISFDQFIVDNIHKELVNFRSLRNFIYYTYLQKIFLEDNKR
jgi:hypothetical protein